VKRSWSTTHEPWKVGVLFSRTGVTSVIEETQLRGTLLAIDEINQAGGVNGREIVPIIYDPGSDAAAYATYAKHLMVHDEVTMIFGCYTSSSRKVVVPVVERLNGLLWYPTLYEGFEYSPNVIYTGAAPNQNSVALCSYLIKNYGRRFYFVGSDYIYPRESNRLMRELLRSAGGEVVGETYLNLRAKRGDFGPVMRDIRNLMPDVIFSTVVGYGTVYLYQTYAECGLSPRTMPVASLTTTEAEVRAMGHDAAEGHITAASYFQSVGGDRNAAFVARYKQRHGDDEPTNMCAEAAYFQVHIFSAALGKTNSMETDIIRGMILGSDFEAPQGVVAISPMTSHTNLWTRIGRANRRGQFDVILQSQAPIWADPYMVGFGHTPA